MMTGGPQSGFDILVLGAGVSGLTAALSLAEAGVRPLVLEAAKTPGGRARSHVVAGFPGELDDGPHLLVGAYHHTLALMDRLGTRCHLRMPPRVCYHFWRENGGHAALSCPNWPAPWHLAAGVVRSPLFSSREWLALPRLGPALLWRRDLPYGRTVSQWLRDHGQPPVLCRRLWYPLCLSTLNTPADAADAALFVAVLKAVFFQDRWAGRPLLPGKPLSQLIAEPARERIQALGGAVWCGWRVRGLEQSGGMVWEVVTNRGRVVVPKAVIAALPHRALARLLPAWAEGCGMANLHTSPIVSVYLRYGQPFSLPAAMIGLPEAVSQWVFDLGRTLEDPRWNGVFGASLSGAYEQIGWTRQRLVAAVREDLGRMLPGLRHHTPLSAQVIKVHHATFAAVPGVERFRPGPETPWRNFFLAGDWTATGLPATLEGAVASGVLVAQKVLDLLVSGR